MVLSDIGVIDHGRYFPCISEKCQRWAFVGKHFGRIPTQRDLGTRKSGDKRDAVKRRAI
ncbi:MAG: hypothetical protein ABJB74_00355 [Gemmatimonas sp.]